MKQQHEFEVVSIRLVKERPLLSNESVQKPETAIKIIGNHIAEYDREVLCVLNLQADNRPINMTMASIGCLDSTLVSPREILKSAILSNAANIILLHNHPSGNPTPSKQDIDVTKRMHDACELLGFHLLDHIIVGDDNSYYSFKIEGLMKMNDSDIPTELNETKNEMKKKDFSNIKKKPFKPKKISTPKLNSRYSGIEI